MKKLILIMLVASLGLVANAQEQNKPFLDDTIKADTNGYVSNMLVDGYSNTVVIFAFTKVDVTDSLSAAKIQGSMDNVVFYDLTNASANLTNTSADGVTRLYVENPVDLFHRGLLTAATGDTVAVTNAGIYIKKQK